MKKGLIKPVAVFIDAANFEISLKQSSLRVNYKKLLASLKGEGKMTTLRYYGPDFGTKGQDRFFTFIKKLGFKIVTKKIKVIKQRAKQAKHKANFDVEIAFDAAMKMGEYKKLILFSGDSDFLYLVTQLQKKGINVIVISPQWRTARELKKQVDKFIDLKDCDFVEKIKRLPEGSAHNNLSTARVLYYRRKGKSRKKRL